VISSWVIFWGYTASNNRWNLDFRESPAQSVAFSLFLWLVHEASTIEKAMPDYSLEFLGSRLCPQVPGEALKAAVLCYRRWKKDRAEEIFARHDASLGDDLTAVWDALEDHEFFTMEEDHMYPTTMYAGALFSPKQGMVLAYLYYGEPHDEFLNVAEAFGCKPFDPGIPAGLVLRHLHDEGYDLYGPFTNFVPQVLGREAVWESFGTTDLWRDDPDGFSQNFEEHYDEVS
jgi:hypothetical protein